MTLKISSPNIFPFGLLNNSAYFEIVVNNQQFSSVTEFVYVSMFSDPIDQENMRFNLFSPISALYVAKQQSDEKIFKNLMFEGVKLRLEDNQTLRFELYETGNKKLISDQPNLVVILNRFRFNPEIYYDEIKKVEVDRTTVLKVIAGIEEKILSEEDVKDLPFEELKQFALDKQPEFHYGESFRFQLNHLVPLIRNSLQSRLKEMNIIKFKEHLLDVYLDYVLETEYPAIAKSDYALAKKQQVDKERNISYFENRLFDLYKTGQIDHLVTKRLKFFEEKVTTPLPNITLNGNDSVFDVRNLIVDLPSIHKPTEDGIIIKGSRFDPMTIIPFKVKEVVYNSPAHYAFDRLFAALNLKVNVNSFSFLDLKELYKKKKDLWFETKLSENYKIALNHKFADETLKSLLVETEPAELILNEQHDNFDGILLMELRDAFIKLQPKGPLLGANILDNVWTKKWFVYTVDDYINTLKLTSFNLRIENFVKNCNKMVREISIRAPALDLKDFDKQLNNLATIDSRYKPLLDNFNRGLEAISREFTLYLANIYSFDRVDFNLKLNENEIMFCINYTKLNMYQIRVIEPLITTVYFRFVNQPVSEMIKSVKKNFDFSKPEREVMDRAVHNLEKLFVERLCKVDVHTFISSILTIKQTSNTSKMLWNRVNMFGKYISSIE